MIAYKSVVINYRVLRCEGNKPQFQLEYNNEAFNVRAIDSALARDAVARGTADHVTDRSHDHSHACHVTSLPVTKLARTITTKKTGTMN